MVEKSEIKLKWDTYLEKNNIDIIYVVKPLCGAHNIIKDTLNKNCFIENNETEILDSFLLIPCDDIKN